MKAVILNGTGGTEQLELVDLPTPDIGPGQVRVRLRAAALNHRDLWIRRGMYSKIRLPAVLGSDGAGEVDAAADDVAGFSAGQRVVICPSLDWGDDPRRQGSDYRIIGMPDPGTFAEQIVVPAENVFAAPDHLDWPELASLPVAGITAWRSLFTQGRIQSGERVLVTGVGGGVATMAMVLAIAAGGRVFVSSGDQEKIDRAIELGAEGGVIYKDDDWESQLLSMAGGDMDMVVDGTAGPTFPRLVNVTGYAGRIVVYGATLGDPEIRFDIRRIFWRHIQVIGSTMGTPAEFGEMLQFISQNQVHPVVDRQFALHDMAAAQDHLEASDQMGKVVIRID